MLVGYQKTLARNDEFLGTLLKTVLTSIVTGVLLVVKLFLFLLMIFFGIGKIMSGMAMKASAATLLLEDEE